ncbi:hypothetical protein N431DRAFT_427109 [Stipitochalara longipes BDJ]|nr:hypothetical protein N431DRAFT_427109 [Stipitochalara longipes BDJ]
MQLSFALLAVGLALVGASMTELPSMALSATNAIAVPPLNTTEHKGGGGDGGGGGGGHGGVDGGVDGGDDGGDGGDGSGSSGSGGARGGGEGSEGAILRENNALLGCVMVFAGAVLFWGEI